MTAKVSHMTKKCSQNRSALLKPLLGSPLREWILLILFTRDAAYPREIAEETNAALRAVQRQLKTLEDYGVVYSRRRGKIRLFYLNPRYPFRRELEALLKKVLELLPAKERERYYIPRLRPRIPGKPVRYVPSR